MAELPDARTAAIEAMAARLREKWVADHEVCEGDEAGLAQATDDAEAALDAIPPSVLAQLAIERGGMEPFGLIWRPKAGSRRWQHRAQRKGRAFPSTSEFVDVYRLTEGDDRG